MEQTPLVSIVSITYNHEKYIRQCLDGFMMQKTNFAFEVLIHDDASTDKTTNIICEYEAKYPDIIKPVYQKENQYSKGIEIISTYLYPKAKGKYIAFCEGDDYWIDPLKLQKQVDFLENNPKYGMVYTGFKTVDMVGNEIDDIASQNMKKSYSGDLFPRLITSNFILTVTTVFQKELLNNIPQKSFIFDHWLFLEAARRSLCHYIPDKEAAYRINPNSVSHSNRNWLSERGDKAIQHEINRFFASSGNYKRNHIQNIYVYISILDKAIMRGYLKKDKFSPEYIILLKKRPIILVLFPIWVLTKIYWKLFS